MSVRVYNPDIGEWYEIEQEYEAPPGFKIDYDMSPRDWEKFVGKLIERIDDARLEMLEERK
jgi:hypothetical protein